MKLTHRLNRIKYVLCKKKVSDLRQERWGKIDDLTTSHDEIKLAKDAIRQSKELRTQLREDYIALLKDTASELRKKASPISPNSSRAPDEGQNSVPASSQEPDICIEPAKGTVAAVIRMIIASCYEDLATSIRPLFYKEPEGEQKQVVSLMTNDMVKLGAYETLTSIKEAVENRNAMSEFSQELSDIKFNSELITRDLELLDMFNLIGESVAQDLLAENTSRLAPLKNAIDTIDRQIKAADLEIQQIQGQKLKYWQQSLSKANKAVGTALKELDQAIMAQKTAEQEYNKQRETKLKAKLDEAAKAEAINRAKLKKVTAYKESVEEQLTQQQLRLKQLNHLLNSHEETSTRFLERIVRKNPLFAGLKVDSRRQITCNKTVTKEQKKWQFSSIAIKPTLMLAGHFLDCTPKKTDIENVANTDAKVDEQAGGKENIGPVLYSLSLPLADPLRDLEHRSEFRTLFVGSATGDILFETETYGASRVARDRSDIGHFSPNVPHGSALAQKILSVTELVRRSEREKSNGKNRASENSDTQDTYNHLDIHGSSFGAWDFNLSKAQAAPRAKKPHIPGSTMIEIEFGGQQQMVFIQPVRLDMKHPDTISEIRKAIESAPKAIGESETKDWIEFSEPTIFYLVGVVPKNTFLKSALKVPAEAVTYMLLVLAVIIFLYPFMRVLFGGTYFSLGRRAVFFLVVAGFWGAGVTFITAHHILNNLAFSEKLDALSKQTADRLRDDFSTELHLARMNLRK